MAERMHTSGKANSLFIVLVVCAVLSLLLTFVNAEPVGPTITVVSNETIQSAAGTTINSTINGTISPGGYIFTVVLTTVQQNNRWKAYVGNVTGTLTLDDTDGNTIYQWPLTSSLSGEVYATRGSGVINWTGINCTWAPEGVASAAAASRLVEENESRTLSHSSGADNITATFSDTNHSAITIGSVIIGKNECFTVQTYQNDASQSFTDSDDANFTQTILYDGAVVGTGNVVYVSEIGQNVPGYDTQLYDFQMIIPENSAPGFSGSTAYYFFVELT